MSTHLQGFRARATAQAEELLQAIASAEAIIVSTIERECEALRTGRMLAAEALHLRLRDAARLYLNATKAARASLWTMEQVVPGLGDLFEERRAAFANVLKVELAVLAAEQAALETAVSSPMSTPKRQVSAAAGAGRAHSPSDAPALRVIAGRKDGPAARSVWLATRWGRSGP